MLEEIKTIKPEEKEHYLGHRKRLRQRFLDSKTESMQDYEVLEMLLFSAQPRKDMKPLAKRLLNKYKNFAKLINSPEEDLLKIDEVNDAILATIKAIKSATDKVLLSEACDEPVLNNWKKLLDYIRSNIGFKTIENMSVIYMNKKFQIICTNTQDHGTIDQVSMYPREIIKKAIHVGAKAIVISHNHPSGDPSPSKSDITATQELMKACAACDIEIIDHLIVSSHKHFSFKAKGLL